MQLSEVTFENQLPVDAYGPGFFRIAEKKVEGSIFLNSGGAQVWAGLSDLTQIMAAKSTFDILFVGTGKDIAPLPAQIRQTFDDAGVAVEVMGSPSACRTYNILLSEGRRVALAALVV